MWLDHHVRSLAARDLLETAIGGTFTSDASEVSLLFALHQMASGGGPEFVFTVEGGSQDSRIVGGMGAVYAPIAAEIAQDDDGVTVRADDMTVRARRAVVAVPIVIAGQIIYEPMLSVDRTFLHQRMPSGAVYKINIVYDEPFWRADGLSGQSAAPETPAPVTIDACTDTATPGVLRVIIEGAIAREMCALAAAERRDLVPASTGRGRKARP